MMSPSLRGRGLKYERFFYGYIEKRVALFTRAWIEMKKTYLWTKGLPSRPLYEGVD